MMASSKTLLKDESLNDRDFEGVISEGDETECSDEIWEYYETHKDELEDLDEYAKKRGSCETRDLELDYFQKLFPLKNPGQRENVA